MSMTTADQVTELLRAHLGVERSAITVTSTLVDLGADSLDAVEIVIGLEDEFSIEIPDEDAEPWKTVGDIITYIEGRVAKK